jgi:endogenous inhibitor of DNA gyrase (YacG/DUF329 family)
MGDCPECDASIEESGDPTLQDIGSKPDFLAAERFYEASCATCGRTVVAGVAGAPGGRRGQ